MHIKISQEQLFQNKEDMIKKEDAIWAVLNALAVPTGRRLTNTDIQILYNIINLPSLR